ncbi:hypothetical protein G6W75_09970 [Staphylococcus sciuri]|uniref:hypothetical protein n=1 Tax=Mammaliicoccus sciuri TaxID=1296 RepID=UPI0013E97930|nr:hypothetical protein [Mammaliicoccus sciuri]NGX76416.1 hypothetical protein [Mammaliicoccus sciuri]
MKKNKKYNTLVETWLYIEDECKSINILTLYDSSINEVFKSNKHNGTETLAIYKLTKKGKLKLIYFKEDIK